MWISTQTIAILGLAVVAAAVVGLCGFRGDPNRPLHRLLVQAITVGLAVASLLTLGLTWAGGEIAWAALVVFVGGWLAEYTGQRTGYLFGRYTYSDFLRPRLGGVPLAVPVAYLAVVPTAWGIADRLLAGSRGPDFICAAAAITTVWDLLLDPLFVQWKAWTWSSPGGYFGIPWRNFAGWFTVSAVMTALVQPGPLESTPFIWLYTGSWVFGTAAVFKHVPSWRPGLAGGAVMGLVVALAWLRAP